MSLIAYIAVGLLILGAAMFAIGMALPETSGTGEFFGIGGMIVAFCAMIVFTIWGISGLFYRAETNECARFGEQAEIDTKMVRYNTVDFDCLVRADSGWVSKDNYWNSER